MKIIESILRKIVVKRGNEYDFLNIEIKCTKDRLVRYNMRERLIKAAELFGESDLEPVMSPAKNNLFKFSKKLQRACEMKRQIFHSMVMLMHCVSHRGRQDLQPATSVLASRIRNANEHGKLRRLIRCAKGIIDLVHYLGVV